MRPIVHMRLNHPRSPKARTAAWNDRSSSSSCRIRASTISLPSTSDSAFLFMSVTSSSTSTTRRAAVTTSSALSANSLAEPKNSFATSAIFSDEWHERARREQRVDEAHARRHDLGDVLVLCQRCLIRCLRRCERRGGTGLCGRDLCAIVLPRRQHEADARTDARKDEDDDDDDE